MRSIFSNIKTIVRPYFSTVIICVNSDGKYCNVFVKRTKGGAVLEEVTRTFRTYESEFPMEAAKFIRSYKRKYPFSYLATISRTYNQGILDTNDSENMALYGVDVSENKVMYFKEGFSIYLKENSIKDIQYKFMTALGLDYLFSPFLIAYLCAKDDLDIDYRLYILQERTASTIIIVSQNGVHFGGYFMIDDSIESNIELQSQEMGESGVDKILGSLDNLKDELEESGYLDSFTPSKKPIDHKQNDEEIDYSRAVTIASIINSCLNEFYNNDIYNSKFVEEIILLDTYGITDKAIQYISENTMMDVRIEDVNILKCISILTKEELKLIGEIF